MSRNAATYSTFYFHGQYFSHAHGSLAKGPIKIDAQLQCAQYIKKRIFSKYSQMYAVPCMCQVCMVNVTKVRETQNKGRVGLVFSDSFNPPPFSPLVIFSKKKIEKWRHHFLLLLLDYFLLFNTYGQLQGNASQKVLKVF